MLQLASTEVSSRLQMLHSVQQSSRLVLSMRRTGTMQSTIQMMALFLKDRRHSRQSQALLTESMSAVSSSDLSVLHTRCQDTLCMKDTQLTLASASLMLLTLTSRKQRTMVEFMTMSSSVMSPITHQRSLTEMSSMCRLASSRSRQSSS